MENRSPKPCSRPPAGVGSRAYAFIVDWHIRVLLALLWLVSVYALAGIDSLLLLVPPALIYLLYHPLLEWAMAGTTPGKRKAGLRIVNARGEKPGAFAIMARNCLRVVDALPVFYGLGICLVLLEGDGMRLGDRLAGTRVVYDRAEALPIKGCADLACELLVRWPELEPARRAYLARRLMADAGEEVAVASDDDLRRRLDSLCRQT